MATECISLILQIRSMNENRVVCLDLMNGLRLSKPPAATFCHGQKGNQVKILF